MKSVKVKGGAKKPSKNHTKLVEAAKTLFAADGYAKTNTEDIVQLSGVTRGALYYQFRDKQHLFEVVFELTLASMAEDLFQQTMKKIKDDAEDLEVGTQILLDLYSRSDIKQIVLLDGPVVLGWQTWRALQAPIHMGLLTHALEHLIELKTIPKQPLEPLAELIMGALIQAGLAIANADDIRKVRRIYGKSLRQLLAGIAPGKFIA